MRVPVVRGLFFRVEGSKCCVHRCLVTGEREYLDQQPIDPEPPLATAPFSPLLLDAKWVCIVSVVDGTPWQTRGPRNGGRDGRLSHFVDRCGRRSSPDL